MTARQSHACSRITGRAKKPLILNFRNLVRKYHAQSRATVKGKLKMTAQEIKDAIQNWQSESDDNVILAEAVTMESALDIARARIRTARVNSAGPLVKFTESEGVTIGGLTRAQRQER
jgi:hypothetical protein